MTDAFIDVLTEQERLRTADGSLEIAQLAAEATARRVSAGKVSPIEKNKGGRGGYARPGRWHVTRCPANLQAMLGPVISGAEGIVVLPSVPPETGAIQTRPTSGPRTQAFA